MPTEADRRQDMILELNRASSALSRANAVAVDPYRSLLGALLDSIVAIEELIEDQTAHSDGTAP